MKIVVFGASGVLGRRITQEALDRGHDVIAVVRDPSRLTLESPRLTAAAGDVTDSAQVAKLVVGHDVVISAVGPGVGDDPTIVVHAARSLIAGVPAGEVKRLIVVNGAGSLEVAPGVQLVDTPDFHDAWKPVARAHRDALALYRAADLDWTVVSPAALIQPGERTGHYRTGSDQLLVDDTGASHISAGDFAIALLDEAEHPRAIRRRITVAS
ncbi:MAG TPA: NAD(P)-dependent oxidoreductase [Chloroflexota bacterium]|nr:NAD(P)-dependent oxidoreductase [Chloroflexota bacterium]